MKRIVAVIFMFGSICGFGQDEVKKESRLSICINYSLNHSYRTLKYTEEYKSFVQAREKGEAPSLGFNTGVSVYYLIMENIELEGGAQFSRQTHQFKDITIAGVNNEPIGHTDLENQYSYLEIPVRANYRILNRKLFVHITCGISANIFIDSRSINHLVYNDGTTEKVIGEDVLGDYNKLIFAIIAGLGVGYKLTDEFELRFEPLFRYSLQPIMDTQINQYNYSFGGQLGLSMKL